MKTEQIKALLLNKKIDAKNKQVELQQKLFSLGLYFGDDNDSKIRPECGPYFYIHENINEHKELYFTWDNSHSFFEEHHFTEMSVDEVLAITID